MKIKQLAKPLVTLIIVLLAGSVLSVPAQAKVSYVEGTDPAAVMFDPVQVSSINLQMSTDDYNSLRYPNVSYDNEGPWLETSMTAVIAGRTYTALKVGVHLKGAWGSWRDITQKAAFKIKLDAFVPGQKLLGVSKLTLNNMVQDSSYIHEAMTYKLMRTAGIPAPRTGYANVKLNGVNYGLHLNVETIGKTMLKRWGLKSQHIYKGSLPNFPDFVQGNDPYFTIESGSPTDTTDLANFIAVNKLSGDSWWDAIKTIADMEEITKLWAAELYTGHWDGYTLNLNNYFVNFNDQGKASLLAWGTDQTWSGPYDYFNFRGVLANKCKGSNPCMEMYLQSLAKVANAAKKANLQNFATVVKSAIYSNIVADPMGPGIGSAAGQQNSTIATATLQSTMLSALVAPWDTTYETLMVNDLYYTAGRTVYLQPNVKKASITLLPTQQEAKAFPVNKKVHAGFNTATVVINSADSLHTTEHEIMLYRLTQRNSKFAVRYTSNSSVTKSGADLLAALTDKLALSRNTELTFTLGKSSSTKTNELRIQKILSQFKAAGIVPRKVTRLYVSGNAQLITLNADYQN